jgi:tRNA(Ile)-lysidine synthase
MRTRPDRHPLARRLRQHLEQTGLVPGRSHLLVALSGGLDSVVLLHLFRFGAIVPALRISAAHLDHAMRADSSRDADWVSGLATAWRVPLRRDRLADSPRSEAAARNARYQFLDTAARDLGADRIATAHHADDQAETVLFRMLRGTGVGGLSGIAEQRGRLVRPLLPYSREDLLEYAIDAGVHWREDPSNTDPRFARNRIRHRLLPALEAEWPGASVRLARLAADAAGMESMIRPELERLRAAAVRAHAGGLLLDRPLLQAYHPWSRARVVRDALTSIGARPDHAAVRAILRFLGDSSSGTGLDLVGGLRIERSFDSIAIRAIRAPDHRRPDRPLVVSGPGPGRGRARIGDRIVRVAWGTAARSAGHVAAFDTAELCFPLTVRGWRAGDRIRFSYGSKRVKKLWGERRVARTRRESVPVLVDGEGRVLWLVGVARSIDALPRVGHAIMHFTVENDERD